jgi:N-formylglutamate amidohydrolase
VRSVTDLTVTEGAAQVGLVGVPLQDSIVVLLSGPAGPVAGVDVVWTALAGGEVRPARSRTDDRGRAMALYIPAAGADSVSVVGGDQSAVVQAFGGTAIAGTHYLGRNSYAEYRAGTLPLIISAPHGGTIEPAEIPHRTFGVVARDRNTDALAIALANAIESRFGERPHLIISQLHRSKLDPNREIVEAAQGDPLAEQTWREFHGFIEHARARVLETHGDGFYLDLHGHGHAIQRLELGYLLNAQELARSDAELDRGNGATDSSIRALVERSGVDFSNLLRGPDSLGSLLEDQGYSTTPSDAQPDPGNNPFFSGGYNTARHGSRDGGSISGVQIEAQFNGVRDTAAPREAFAAALATALEAYLGRWYP